MIDSFTILSKHHVLLGSQDQITGEATLPSLDVYEFGYAIDTPILRHQFQLPALSHYDEDVELEICAEPMPSRSPHPDSPFFSNPESRACIVNVTLGNYDERSSFFFLLNDLLERVLDPGLNQVAVPWEDWKVQTRWFDQPMPYTSWVRFLFFDSVQKNLKPPRFVMCITVESSLRQKEVRP